MTTVTMWTIVPYFTVKIQSLHHTDTTGPSNLQLVGPGIMDITEVLNMVTKVTGRFHIGPEVIALRDNSVHVIDTMRLTIWTGEKDLK